MTTGKDLLAVSPASTCGVCKKQFLDDDQVIVVGDDVRHAGACEKPAAEVDAQEQRVRAAIAASKEVAPISPAVAAAMKAQKKLKSKQPKFKAVPGREDAAAEASRAFVAIGKQQAIDRDGLRAVYEPRRRVKASWQFPRHAVQVRMPAGVRGKTVGFEYVGEDPDAFETALSEAMRSAEEWALNVLKDKKEVVLDLDD